MVADHHLAETSHRVRLHSPASNRMLSWRISQTPQTMSLLPFLHRAAAGADLSSQEAYQAMSVLLEGQASESLIAAFLVALKMKGETAGEFAGFARAMRERMIFVDAHPDVVDTCGTGGDGSGTFNISTVAALIMAGPARASPSMGTVRSPAARAARMCSKPWASAFP